MTRMLRMLALLAILLPGYLCLPGNAAPRKNVLFIAVDDLNDWVGFLSNAAHPGAGGCPGPVFTPHLDRLAARGTAFTNAHCAAPVCCPSRAAVMSGLLPTSTGIYNNQHWWKPNLPDLRTIPIHFRENGYHTVGAGKIYHHTAGNNPPGQWDDYQRMLFNDNGWIRHGSPLYPWTAPKSRPAAFPYSGIKLYSGEADWGVLPQPEASYDDSLVADYAVNYLQTLEQRGHEKPFFLACGLFHPHMPWYVPRKYLDLYPLDKIVLPPAPGDDLADVPDPGRKLALRKSGDLSRLREAGKWKTAVQHYLASITFADTLVGRVLAALDRSPAAGNTIIVLWSDHGWHLGEKGHWHKRTLWEEATRVPFIIVAPGVGDSNQRCAQAVSLVDIFPTLIELCSLPPVRNLDGMSLVPWLLDPGRKRLQPAITIEERGHVSVRTAHYRAIHYQTSEWELYDHRNDPNEWTNLARDPEHASVLRETSRWIPARRKPSANSKKAYHFDPDEFTWRHRKTGRLTRGK